MPRLRLPAGLLALLMLSQTGCYDWVPVDPADATKLSGSFVTPVVGMHNVLAVRVVDVQQPDGSLVELSGDYDVRVTLTDGSVEEFSHPVQVDEEEGNNLTFRGGNHGPMTVAKANIETLEASQYSRSKTVAAVLVPTLLVTAAGLLAVAASSRH